MTKPPNVWLGRQALDTLLTEAQSLWPLETGGVLLGYTSDNAVVVQRSTGPGPRAEHSSKGFAPDSTYHAEEMERGFSESNGTTYYLGDWHTHPGGSVRLSRKDQRTLVGIGDYALSFQPHPVMLIAARGRDEPWRFAAWRLTGRWGFGPFSLPRITVLRPKVYDDD